MESPRPVECEGVISFKDGQQTLGAQARTLDFETADEMSDVASVLSDVLYR
jgi:hypothetical protein